MSHKKTNKRTNKRTNLKVAIIENQIKGYELAKMLNISGQYLSDIVSGVGNLSEAKQIEVAKILDRSKDLLFLSK